MNDWSQGHIKELLEDRSRALQQPNHWCTVCLAGGVMLQAALRPDPPGVLLREGRISAETAGKLCAIDELRRGGRAGGADLDRPGRRSARFCSTSSSCCRERKTSSGTPVR